MKSGITPWLVLSPIAALFAVACSSGHAADGSSQGSDVVAGDVPGTTPSASSASAELTCAQRLAAAHAPGVTKSTLRIAAAATFKPFSFQNAGSSDIVGIDADILAKAADLAGITYTLENADWGLGCCTFPGETTPRAPTSAAESPEWFGVASGTYDLIVGGISMKPDRLQVFTTTHPLYSAPFFGFVTKSSSSKTFDLTFGTGLANATIAVQHGTTFESYAKLRYPLAGAFTIATQNDAAGALDADHADLLLVQLSQAGVAEKLASGDYKIVKADAGDTTGLLDQRDPQGFVNVWGRGTMWVHKPGQNPDLVRTLDCAIDQVTSDTAFFTQLADKWAGSHVRTPLPAQAPLPATN
jgi:ABC-type amino acid transport substrate-binding protein